ncbi:MAG: 30S ribosomal protein S2 [Bacteroidia bacterium]|nr:30S ribosomal protein S2 [Bacteroidia bacterium]
MSQKVTLEQLIEAGVHFGHLRSKWNPAMAPYIYGEKNGTHIIDLNKTLVKIEEAANALRQIAKSGKTILFVATKKQAKDIVAQKVSEIGMPYVTERWPGGMLTNFATIRRSVRRMNQIEKMLNDGTFDKISKKERLTFTREKDKLKLYFGSIANLTKLPAAVFVVDIIKEHIAVAEARKLNIPTFAIVDTNANPADVDFPIPGNDDASTSISLIVDIMCNAIKEGLSNKKTESVSFDEEQENFTEKYDRLEKSANEEDGEVATKRKRKLAAKK